MRHREGPQSVFGRPSLRPSIIYVLVAGLAFSSHALAQTVSAPPAGKPSTAPVEEPKPEQPAPGDEMGPPAPLTAKQLADRARAQAAAQDQALALSDDPEFPIGSFVIEYDREHPNLPPLEQLLKEATVTLRKAPDGGFTGPRDGQPASVLSIAELNAKRPDGAPVPKYSRRAIASVLEAIKAQFTQRRIAGVLIEADQEDLVVERLIGPAGDQLVWRDLREGERDELRLRIYTVTVAKVQTAASGNRLRRTVDVGSTLFFNRLPSEMVYDLQQPPDSNPGLIDHPEHADIKAGSPVQPYAPSAKDADPKNRKDLLRQTDIDEYVLGLNRHPNRRVDVTVTGGENPGEVVLMYLVRENNPLMFYTQVSNTGTAQTNEWRQRVGFQHTQLTGNDDILAVDYVTAWGKSNVLNANYDFPLGPPGSAGAKWRAKLSGVWSNFDASEVGRAGEAFKGDSYSIGAQLSYNVWQDREAFVDAFAGVRYDNVRVENKTFAIVGRTGFLLPSLGVRYERATEESSTSAQISIEGNLAGAAGTSATEIVKLGRPDTDRSWTTLQFAGEHSFYLEPIMQPEAWSRGQTTLAHEVSLSMRGQHAFGSRLAPSFQQIGGGLYSARGYDESITSGDNSFVASLEYRLHLPRLLDVQEESGTLFGRNFRWAPQQPYGRPDWDLIVRPFFDVARLTNSQRTTFERDVTLMSAGLGLELMYRRNVNIRADWGFVLRSVPGKAERGDNRLHLVATILF